MIPFSSLQDASIYTKLAVLIEKLNCAGCNNDGTSGNGGAGIDGGMKQLLIRTIERINCHECSGG